MGKDRPHFCLAYHSCFGEEVLFWIEGRIFVGAYRPRHESLESMFGDAHPMPPWAWAHEGPRGPVYQYYGVLLCALMVLQEDEQTKAKVDFLFCGGGTLCTMVLGDSFL